MLVLENISKKIGSFEINNVNLLINEGEYFVFLGRSGAGKSVLLELISGLIFPDKGRIKLNNIDITDKRIQKRNIGLVFQNHSLFPHMNVWENIVYSVGRGELKFSRNKIVDLSALMGIENLFNRYPDTLSIGEAQRVALARTLISEPSLLLLDEPLASLDTQMKGDIRSLLRKINRGEVNTANKTPMTLLHVTHDYEEAIALASRIAVIENGNITQVGAPDEIFLHPKTKFVADFIGIKNFYKGKISSAGVFTISGNSLVNINTSYYQIADNACLILRSEDIIISNTFNESSARNNFKGVISDMEKVKNGIDITADVNGVKISSLITPASQHELNLEIGKTVYLSFKATAGKVIIS